MSEVARARHLSPSTVPTTSTPTRGGLRRRLRQAGLALTALLPSPVKKLVYRWCLGYRIEKQVRLGLVYLDCASLTIGDDSRIAHGVVFLNCGAVEIGQKVDIGALNL